MSAEGGDEAAATTDWLHRGPDTQVWVRLRPPAAGTTPEALVIATPGGDGSHVVPLERREGRDQAYDDARVDLDRLLPREASPEGRWPVRLRTSDGALRDVTAEPDERVTVLLDHGDVARAAEIADDGPGLAVTVTRVAPWAEVERIAFDRDTARLRARLVGTLDEATLAGPWEMAARLPEDRTRESSAPGNRQGRRLQVDLAAFAPDTAGSHELVLRAADGTELPVARRLDDIGDKAQAILYPALEVPADGGTRRLRPAYGPDHTLVLRVADPTGSAGELGPARAGPGTPASGRVEDARATAGKPVGEGRPAAGERDRLTRVVTFGLRVAGRLARETRRLHRLRPRDADTIHLVLLNAYAMGGTIRTVWNLAEALAHRSDVRLVSVLRERERPYLAPRDSAVRLVDVDDRRRVRRRGPGGPLARLRAELARRPSVLVTRHENRYDRFTLLTDVLLVARLWRLPRGVLMTTRPALNLVAVRHAPGWLALVGQEHLLFEAHGKPLRRLLVKDYPRLDALTVLTEEDERSYRARLPEGRPIIRHIPNAVPDVPFPRSDGTGRHVIAAGRVTGVKDFATLIRAYAPVVERHPDWSLRIYGNGPEVPRLERLIRELGVGEHVHLMGRTDRLWQEMAKGSIFAVSSRFEGFGMVLIEAFACGLPVVSFACPRGPREIVKHEDNGLLVPEQDREALTAGLLRMIEDDELRARCAAGALASGEHYAMAAVEQRWRDLFRDAVGR